MTQPELPENLRDFLHECIPHVDAAEVLLLLAKQPGRVFALRDLIEELRPAIVSEATVQQYLTRFESVGLVARHGDGYLFAPSSPQHETAVRALEKLYNEMPVTLVRMIYAPKADPIRAFADAFKIRKS